MRRDRRICEEQERKRLELTRSMEQVPSKISGDNEINVKETYETMEFRPMPVSREEEPRGARKPIYAMGKNSPFESTPHWKQEK